MLARVRSFPALPLLLVVYAAITLHMLLIWWFGGMPTVPLIVFGASQYAPALIVLASGREARARILQLFKRVPPVGELLRFHVATIFTLAVCIVVPYLFGHHARAYDENLGKTYPLHHFVPNAVLHSVGYGAFIILLGPMLHFLNALGEEVFWRGYLLDSLRRRYSRAPAYLLNGVFWGIWHTPMIVFLDWDFPGHPALGVLVITVSQIFWSIVLCALRERSDSLWVPVIMHATANAMTIGLYDLLVDHQYNLFYSPWGLLGGAVMALLSIPTLRELRERQSAPVEPGALQATQV